MITEKGAMSWMSPNMHMATSTNGGIGKAFGRMFSGESMFQNIYTAQGGPGMIAFASCFPGSILPYQISPGRELIVQKSGFLASEAGVNLSVFFQKRFGSGLFGGEGFICLLYTSAFWIFHNKSTVIRPCLIDRRDILRPPQTAYFYSAHA